jgi:hypothetical protein
MSNSPLDMYLLICKRYEPFLAHVAHRSDLSYILANLIGELTIGHSWAGGGALPRVATYCRIFSASEKSDLSSVKEPGEAWSVTMVASVLLTEDPSSGEISISPSVTFKTPKSVP